MHSSRCPEASSKTFGHRYANDSWPDGHFPAGPLCRNGQIYGFSWFILYLLCFFKATVDSFANCLMMMIRLNSRNLKDTESIRLLYFHVILIFFSHSSYFTSSLISICTELFCLSCSSPCYLLSSFSCCLAFTKLCGYRAHPLAYCWDWKQVHLP